MKISQKKLSKIPQYIDTLIQQKSGNIYLEQLRVKEYSNRIEPLKGDRMAIIPFSGGLDSTTSLMMALESGINVITVNFNYGQTYYEKERKAINRFTKLIEGNLGHSYKFWTEHFEIDISWLDHELKQEFDGEWKHIFPLRNYVIIKEAANIAMNKQFSELWFSCVRGEIPYSGGDKSAVFLSEVTGELSQQNIRLVTPLIGLGKDDLVHWALSSKQRYENTTQTISCFNGVGETHCGGCQSCFNRAVAFHSNQRTNDCGFEPKLADLNEIVEEYKRKLSGPNYYPSIRAAQINNFISFLENNG